ncbi:MAG: hypothetical protein ACR2NX_12795 [Chthoniobacterales bacterium]
MVWLTCLAWCAVCAVATVISFLAVWWRTRREPRNFSRDRFVGYAVGATASGIAAAFSMWLVTWSGPLGVFAKWIDGRTSGAIWIAVVLATFPFTGWSWNARRRRLTNHQ